MEENPTVKNPNEVLVYDKFKLGRIEGKFNPNMKELKLGGIPMRRQEAENYNAVSYQSGVVFVLDEQATAKYKEYEAQRKADRIAKSSKKIKDAEELLTNVFKTKVKDAINQEAEAEGPTVNQMKAECEEAGYPKKEWQTLKKADLADYLKTKKEEK